MSKEQDAPRHCWDITDALSRGRNYRKAPDEWRSPNDWTISEALRALRLAVEKADRIGGEMKYGDVVSADNPNGLCQWYVQAKSVLDRNAASDVAPAPTGEPSKAFWSYSNSRAM